MREILGTRAARRLLELFTLSGFAIAAPVLEATGRSPEFFVYRAATATQIAALVILLVVALPLVLWGLEQAAGAIASGGSRWLHLGFTGLLLAALVIQVAKRLGLPDGLLLGAAALLVGAGLASLLARRRVFQELLLFASPAPLLFLVLFVAATPAGALVRGGEASADGPRKAIARPSPIVFLFLDEFPLRALLDGEGRIDERLFPNFARLARLATWYPNATGVSGFTPHAAPAILAGRYPTEASAPSYVEYPESLFTLLGGSYRLRAFESITQLCPPALCDASAVRRQTGLDALLRDGAGVVGEILSPRDDTSDPTTQFAEETVAEVEADARDDERPKGVFFRIGEANRNQPSRFAAFLEGLGRSPRPTLHFLHLLLPHAAWRYLPSGRGYPVPPIPFMPRPTGDPATGKLDENPLLSVQGRQRMLLQTAYTDIVLGQLLDHLEATRVLDESLLVVGADHGSGLGPGAVARKLDATNPPDLAWVPLFVKVPRQRAGGRDERNAEMVDVLPTIAEVLGVRVPWRVDGRSLLGPPRPRGRKTWVDRLGAPTVVDDRRWLPAVRRGMAAQVARERGGRRDLFAVGRLAGLVGRDLDELEVGAPSDDRAELDESVDLANVDPAGGNVPALLWGRLAGKREGWLAVAVNGTIAGVAAPFEKDGENRFVGMIDDARLRPGRNRVALYEARGRVLHRLPWSPG